MGIGVDSPNKSHMIQTMKSKNILFLFLFLTLTLGFFSGAFAALSSDADIIRNVSIEVK